MPDSNPKGDLNSIAFISASSTISTPSSEPSASKPRDFTLKREQNSRYGLHNGLTLAALLAGLLLPALLSALAGLLLLLARLLRATALLLAWPALVALLLLAGFLLGILLVRVVHDRSYSYFSPRPTPIRASLTWVQITLSRVNFAA